MKVSKAIAYDIGVHLGDGNMYAKGRTFRITYCGNLENEGKFYKEFLLNAIGNAYNVNPIYTERQKDNTVLIMVNSKKLVGFKRDALELPCGPKDDIDMPKRILNNPILLKWCMRGLGDTDFSLSFKKNKKGINTEPRLEVYTKSKKLAKTLCNILAKFGFTFSVEEKTGKYHGFLLRMYGKKNLGKWLLNFGFSNYWIKLKIAVWKKLGYFPINKNYSELLKLTGSFDPAVSFTAV